MSAARFNGIRFYPDELRDLAIAWIALGVAFSIFIFVATGREVFPDITGAVLSPLFAYVFVVSLLTVGIGFLLHELAHKIVAVRFGQRALVDACGSRFCPWRRCPVTFPSRIWKLRYGRASPIFIATFWRSSYLS